MPWSKVSAPSQTGRFSMPFVMTSHSRIWWRRRALLPSARSKARSSRRPSYSSLLTGAVWSGRFNSTLPMIFRLELSVTGSAGYQPAACMARTMSSRLPTRPIFIGSPGMPLAVRVTIGLSARPG